MSVFNELKRRNVLRVAAAYLAGAWLLVQLASTILPLYGFGEAASRLVVTVLVVAFVPVLVLAWVFQLTPEGVKRDRGAAELAPSSEKSVRRFDRAVIVVLALAVALFGVDRFVLDPARDAARVEAATEQARTDALLESFSDKSIAVLPFEDLSEQGDQEYFSDGVAEELLNLLARIPELRVVGRTSSFSFKDKSATIAEIAETLNVAYVLEGSVRRAGDRLRITAQLIEARTDRHLLSETFDRDMGDIFAIQDEIAAKVVDQLKITLLGPPPVVDETDPEVYALVLQARHINATLLRDSLPLARELLERAIGLAPDYLPARAELGRTYYLLGAGQGSRSEWYAPYRAQFEEVSKRWPNSARANSWLGYITFYFDHDFPAAAAAFERALAAEPTNQDTLQTFLIFVLAMNRPELAIEIGEYLLAREPLCINPCYGVTMSAYVRTSQHERFDAAYAAMQALGLDVAPVARIYIDSLLRRGDPDRALGQAEMMELPAKLVYAAIAHHRLGQLAEYEAVMAELRERARFAPALVYAQVGELDAAFDIVMGLPEPVSPDVFDWDLAPLRQHPRWPELAARSGIWPTDPRSAIHLEVNLPN